MHKEEEIMKKTIDILVVFMLVIAGFIGFVSGSTVSEKDLSAIDKRSDLACWWEWTRELHKGSGCSGSMQRGGDTVFVYDDS